MKRPWGNRRKCRQEQTGLMVAGKGRLRVQVEGSPLAPLPDDASQLASAPELAALSGSCMPKSVVTIGLGLPCKLLDRRTCLRNAPAAGRLVGPEGKSGVWPWPSNTAAHPYAQSKIKDGCRRDQGSIRCFAKAPDGLEFNS